MDSSNDGIRLTSSKKRIVIVADNSLIVEAIQGGLRRSGEFHLLGHTNVRRASARTIMAAQPDAILLDDMDRSERVVELIRELKAEDERIAVIVLSIPLDPAWLEQIFDAGATAAISKASQAVVLATLVRETLDGHIVHGLPGPRMTGRPQAGVVSAEKLPLTGRELEILQLVAAGSTNNEVARTLWVTEPTVKFHLRNIYRKLDVANRTEASHLAHVNGVVGIGENRSKLAMVASGAPPGR